MKKCLFCGNEFEELSKEHIIPNAICGRIKSRNLICKDCNSSLGDEIDNGFNGVYNQVINLFGIKRERGYSEPSIVTGLEDNKTYKYFSNGDYELAESYFTMEIAENRQLSIKIEGPVNKKKLLGDVGKYLSKNKEILNQNGIDYKNAIKETQKYINDNWESMSKRTMPYKPDYIKFSSAFGGININFAILKILYLFLKDSKPDIKFNEENIIEILKTKSENVKNICFYYSLEKNLFDEVDDEISHHICIKSTGNKIVGYIKLFSLTPYICILDDNYNGEPFEAKYGFNLLSQKEFEPTCHYLSDLENLNEKFDYEKNFEITSSNLNQDFTQIMELYYKINPHAKFTEIQHLVNKKLESIIGNELIDTPLVKHLIDSLGEKNYPFTESVTPEYKEKIIDDLVNIILWGIYIQIYKKST